MTPTAPSTQNGCTFSIPQSQAAQSIGVSGGIVTFSVVAPQGCGWAVQSDVAFVAIAGTTLGSGSGSVTLIVQANPGPARTGWWARSPWVCTSPSL